MSTRVLPFASYFNFSSRMSEFRGRIQPPPAPITQPGPSQNQDQATASLLPGQAIQNPPPAPTPRSARRNLFGPIDHEENMKLVQTELARIAESDSRRWNFDFRNEVPLEGRYSWETTKGADIPPAYEMPNLTARLTQLPTPASTSVVKTITSNVTKPTSAPSSNTTEVSDTSTTSSSSSDRSNPLRSTLSTVTTATTTVYTTATIQKQPQSNVTTNHTNTRDLGGTDDTGKTHEHRKEDTSKPKNNTKQTYITDFLKVRKRPRSPVSSSESKAEGLSGTSSAGDPTSSPLLKRAKTT
ncbi:Cyclin-dependent kinase inhibitor 1B [Armadillidium vulgare]|nr:Cyclin-dependent kinase inhibitor 1B [Armadillidium vulgare]